MTAALAASPPPESYDVAVPPGNAMSVDVEDYFQVSAMIPYVRRADWDRMPSRVERNTERLLEIFAEHGTSATFFTLGWVAERFPDLVRRIAVAGHEIASHGWEHIRVRDQSPEAFRADVRRTRALLEDVSGAPVIGYRAASFSMGPETPWAHEILAEEGHLYSSSIFPVRHDHYGSSDAPRFPYAPIADSAFREIPLTTVRVGGRNFPCAGGGYFRLLPYVYFRWALGRVIRHERQGCIFYLHPWEIDPDQPRQGSVDARTRFRHYVNLARTESRLRKVLRDFAWDRMDRAFGIV